MLTTPFFGEPFSMNVLLLYPLFPKSFWSFKKTLALLGLKAMLPPLGLATVAAILPQDWNYKLVDRNVRSVTQAEWDWADLVILSAMIVQKEDYRRFDESFVHTITENAAFLGFPALMLYSQISAIAEKIAQLGYIQGCTSTKVTS